MSDLVLRASQRETQAPYSRILTYESLVHRHVIAVALRAPRRGASDSPPGPGRAGQGGPVPARGPAGAAGMGAAPGVTPCR